MCRRTLTYQKQVDRMARAGAAKERERREERGHHPDTYLPELPALRRVIEITDFDSGTSVTHRFELYRTSRIDCYSVWIDGILLKACIGRSRIMEGRRKALPRPRQAGWMNVLCVPRAEVIYRTFSRSLNMKGKTACAGCQLSFHVGNPIPN